MIKILRLFFDLIFFDFIMTINKKRKYFALIMFVIGVIALILLALLRVFYGIRLGTLQYIIIPIIICFFAVMYRNFSQAVKEDEKYGPTAKH